MPSRGALNTPGELDEQWIKYQIEALNTTCVRRLPSFVLSNADESPAVTSVNTHIHMQCALRKVLPSFGNSDIPIGFFSCFHCGIFHLYFFILLKWKMKIKGFCIDFIPLNGFWNVLNTSRSLENGWYKISIKTWNLYRKSWESKMDQNFNFNPKPDINWFRIYSWIFWWTYTLGSSKSVNPPGI